MYDRAKMHRKDAPGKYTPKRQTKNIDEDKVDLDALTGERGDWLTGGHALDWLWSGKGDKGKGKGKGKSQYGSWWGNWWLPFGGKDQYKGEEKGDDGRKGVKEKEKERKKEREKEKGSKERVITVGKRGTLPEIAQTGGSQKCTA